MNRKNSSKKTKTVKAKPVIKETGASNYVDKSKGINANEVSDSGLNLDGFEKYLDFKNVFSLKANLNNLEHVTVSSRNVVEINCGCLTSVPSDYFLNLNLVPKFRNIGLVVLGYNFEEIMSGDSNLKVTIGNIGKHIAIIENGFVFGYFYLNKNYIEGI
jgi:hypothetical protein